MQGRRQGMISLGERTGKAMRRVGLLDRLTIRWLAQRTQPRALIWEPEPRMIGSYAAGRQMLDGRFLVNGELFESSAGVPFSIQSGPVQAVLHSFAWLDDLAAVGDVQARRFAQAALNDWLARFGLGASTGWSTQTVGRRALRWLGHALFLMQDMDPSTQRRFLKSLSIQAAFLERRAARAPLGLARIECHVALLHAALALDGLSGLVETAVAQLVDATRAHIAPDGSIATRNPEDLLCAFELLCWGAQALSDHQRPLPKALVGYLDATAATLRSLHHADGSLARFHGGGRGREGALSAALAIQSRLGVAFVKPGSGKAMGFARLSAGRSTVIIDAAPPPIGVPGACAHASTLGFELTSNRRPLIVSCGDGGSFGTEWRRASRATALHSTLALEGFSSSRFAGRGSDDGAFSEGPKHVQVEFRHAPYARAVLLSHDGYAASHGLEHIRYLDLSSDGRILTGEDTLVATTRAEQRRFADILARSNQAGIPFALRFHLHPDTKPALDHSETAVLVQLRSGETWEFRAAGQVLSLAPSVYLDAGRAKPQASQQIVLSSRASDYTTQINWTLAKAPDTPIALRDLEQDNPLAVPRL